MAAIIRTPQAIFFTLLLSTLCIHAYATDYYIHPSGGNDKASGTSETQAWKSTAPLSKLSLKPGDKVLFHADDTLSGGLSFENLQGESGQPILFSRYGEGDNPVIDGNGAEAALYFFNPAYLSLENLTITNADGKYGIYMEARNAGEMREVRLNELEIHDVYDASFEVSEPPKTIGGIVFKAQQGEQPSWWNGINIENCHIHDLGSCGISIGSDYKVNKGIEEGQTTYPALNVRIANNLIHDIVRDGAIIRQCKGGVMEYNEVYRTGLVAISNGMWWYDSDSCFIQYNVGHHCKAAFDRDGAPFSIDNSSTRCVIQHNYSHDNEGAGYMVFGHDDTGWGNIIRHNISVNDHTNNIAEGIGSIAVVSRVRDALIHDNIVVAGPSTAFVVGHRSWDGFPVDVTYKNNLFIGNGKALFGHHVLPAGKFEANYFINIPNLPESLQQQNELKTFFEKSAHLEESFGGN